MRVELTQDFTDDSRGFLGLAGIAQTQAIHSEQDPALDGFQTVTGVRKRTGHDDGHRVIDVRRAHLLVDVDLLDDTAARNLFVLLFNFHKIFLFNGVRFAPYT